MAEEAAAAETQSGAALEMGSSPRTKQLGHVMKIIMTLLASPTFPKSWMGGAMTNRLTDRPDASEMMTTIFAGRGFGAQS